jgi:DNA invertase Pin-like site-specific DNA recombinase
MSTYAYTRVSTMDQADSGLGLSDQEEKIRSYAKMRDLQIDRLFVDNGISGTVPIADRPAGGEMVALLKRGDAVIFVRIDRGFRDAGDALSTLRSWDKKGITAHIVDLNGMSIDISTAMGRVMVGILACFAEWQVNSIRDNTRSALRVKIKRMEKTGGRVPYGFKCFMDSTGERKVKKLIPDEDEQKVIDLIKDLRRSGKTPVQVAQILNDHRIRPREAHLWAPNTISKILSRGHCEISRSDALPKQSDQP